MPGREGRSVDLVSHSLPHGLPWIKRLSDIMPSTFLLSAPSIPSLSQMSNNQSPVVSSFQRFKDALRQRANGRTPLLDGVLSNVEYKAKQIEADLEVMNDVDEASWCAS